MPIDYARNCGNLFCTLIKKGVSVAYLVFIASIIASTSCEDFTSNSHKTTASTAKPSNGSAGTSTDKSKYKIMLTKPTDTPGKSQIELHALVPEKVTDEDVKAILTELYDQAKATTGFEHRLHPNAIYIHVFGKIYEGSHDTSQVGFLEYNENNGDTSPNITINSEKLKAIFQAPEVKFGLSEEKRKDIYHEWGDTLNQAVAVAEKSSPLLIPGSAGYTAEKAAAAEKKQRRLINTLTERYRVMLIKKKSLTEEQFKEIEYEGFSKCWPFPKLR